MGLLKVLGVVAVLGMVFLLSLPNVPASGTGVNADSMQSHEPIRINSDAELEQMVQDENWSGEGTFLNPYYIKYYEINGNGSTGIYIGNTTKWIMITHCYLYNSTNYGGTYYYSAGVEIYNAHNISVYNTNVSNSEYGIVLDHGYSSIYIGNDEFYNNTNFGVGVFMSTDGPVSISDSEFKNGGVGIYLSSDVNNVTVKNNYISSMMGEGIFINGYSTKSANNEIYHNTIYYSSYGIYLGNNLAGSKIENNTIVTSYLYGIEGYKLSNTTISNNTIRGSLSYGIFLNDSSGNVIYQNMLLYNNGGNDTYNSSHVQAFDNGSNQWFYLARGNYWSDWTTPDDDGDGIVDNPYNLDGSLSNVDPYPLAEPPQPIPEFSPYFFLAIFAMIIGALFSRKK